MLREGVRPDGRNANTCNFDRCAGIAAARIHASCKDSVKAYLHNMRDPHTMWLELKNKLDTVNSCAGQTALLHRFNQLRSSPNQSIANYITELMTCSKELPGSEQEIPKETVVSHLLTTLAKEFDSIIDIITHRPAEEQTTDGVIATLIEWKSINETQRTGPPQSTNRSSTMLALAALAAYTPTTISRKSRPPTRFQNQVPCNRSTNQRTSNFRSSKKANSNSSVCWYCLKPGHQKQSC